MDAFTLLKADHEKVAQLFDQLEAARGAAKLRVFQQIRTELELHAHIEEKIFYPAVEKPEETHDLTLEAYEEHDVVKKLLSQLGRARRVSDEWEAQAKVLQENVEHHVEEEENELFGKTADVLSEEEIEELGQRMEAEKARKQRGGSSRKGSKKSSKKSAKKSGSSKKSAQKSSSSKTAKKTTGTKKAGKSASKSSSKTKKRSGTKKSAAKKR